MPFDTTILTKKIEGLKEAVKNGRFDDALSTAINTGNGLMQQRVFQQTEDVNGQPFGQYVGLKRKARLIKSSSRTQNKRNKSIAGQSLTSYQRKRAKAGRQIAKKDLEFSGGLRRAIETQVENEKSVTLQFNTDKAAKVAHGQEQQITNIRNGKSGTTKGTGAVKIFKLSKAEKDKVIEQGAELIKQILKPK